MRPEVQRWITAIEAATAEAGAPCGIVGADQADGTFSWGWYEIGKKGNSSELAYVSVHKALVLAEPIRPGCVAPSRKLVDILAGNPI